MIPSSQFSKSHDSVVALAGHAQRRSDFNPAGQTLRSNRIPVDSAWMLVHFIRCSLSICRGWGDGPAVHWWLHTIIAAVGCGFSRDAIGSAGDRPTDCTAAHGHIAAFCIDGGLVTSLLCSTRRTYVRPGWNWDRVLALFLRQRVHSTTYRIWGLRWDQGIVCTC